MLGGSNAFLNDVLQFSRIQHPFSQIASSALVMPPRPRNSHLLEQVRLGDEIEVWWPHDAQYYSGVVGCRLPSGRHRILYNDGEVEDLRLATEQWRFIGAAAQRVLATRSTPPPLDVASSAVQSQNSGPKPNPSAQSTPLSESTSTGKTPSLKKRGRPKGRKSDSTKSATSKITRTKKTSSEPNEKTADGSGAIQSSGTLSAPRASTTEVKKRQRSSSTTTQHEQGKNISQALASHDPSLLDVGSGLIDAAPLRATTMNSGAPSQPSASAPRPSTVLVTPVVAQSGNISDYIDVPQQKISADRQKPALTASVAPPESTTKQFPVKPSRALGNQPSNVTSPNSRAQSANDTRPGDQRALAASEAIDLQSSRKNTSSSSLGTHNATNQNKEPKPPRTAQQRPREEEKDKRKTKSVGRDISTKKSSASANVLGKEGISSRTSEARRGQTFISRSTLSQETIAPNANSATNSPEVEQRLTNGRTTLKPVSAMISGASRHGEKGARANSGKKNNQGKETQDPDAGCLAQTKLPTVTGDGDATGDDSAKQDSPKDQAKGPPESVPDKCTESSPTPKTMADSVGPLMALMARVAANSENRRLESDTISWSPSSRPGSGSGPLRTNSNGTGSPRNSVDNIIKRGSRPSADAKGTSKSKGGNLGKLSGVKKAITKPTRSVLKKQATTIVPSRKQMDGNSRRAGVNPNDGSDIVADVNVPRKPRGGPASPLLQSPLSGLRHPVFSPSKVGSRSGVMGQKASSGADLKNISEQLAPATSPSLSGDRSPLVKAERAGSKLGPFQPTKRRSAIHRQDAASQVEQQNLTNSLSKSTHFKITDPAAMRDKKQKLSNKSKPLQSDSQHEGSISPVLSKSIPDRANQMSGKSKQQSQIPNAEQAWPGTRRSAGDEQVGSNSTRTKPVSVGSGQAKKNLIQSAGESAHESVDRSKPSDESAEKVLARAKGDMVDTVKDVSRPQRIASREEHRHGNVNQNEDRTVRASTTPRSTLTTTSKAETGARVNGGVKRTASEQGNKVKRRKFDSSEKQDLGQEVNATAAPVPDGKSAHIPKMLPGSSPPACEQSIMEPDKVPSKGNSIPIDRERKSPVPNSAQPKQATNEVAEGDRGEKLRGERAEKPQNVGADLVSSGSTQSEPVVSIMASDTDRSRLLECGPSAVTAARAAVSTAPLQSQQSVRDASIGKGVAIAQFSTHHRDASRPCPESVIQVPASSELVNPREVGAQLPNGENQQAQESPNPPLQNAKGKTLQELHPPSMTTNRMSPHESQPATPAPRSFARVRARQSTGSFAGDENLSLTARLSEDPDRATASLPLETLTRTITEANRKSLQAGLAPLASRFEKFFTDNDKFLRSLQGQVDKATKTMESLQEGVVGVQNAVASIPSTKEIRTFLESHTEETKQAMTQELKSVTSELKYSLHDYLKRELESAMNSVAMQIQRDSVMLISKAIDNAMSSGLMHDHPRVASDGGARVEKIQEGRNETNKEGDLARYTGVDSDDIPLAHQFGLNGSAGKDKPSLSTDTAAPILAPVGSRSQQGTTAWNGVSTPEAQVCRGAGGNPNLLEKEKASLTRPVPQSTQDARQKPQRNSLSSSPAANASGKERSILPNISRKPTVRKCDAQNSDETVYSRDKRARVPQKEGSEVGPEGNDIIRNNAAPGASVSPDIPANPSRAPVKDRAGLSPEEASVAGENPQENARTRKRDPARRERHKQVTLEVRTLLARCAVEWFLSGGCRDVAPGDERTTSVSGKWVKDSVLRCLDGIVRRLENEDTFEGAMKDLADSVGPGIETDWLLQGPTVSNINKARENYTEWDPQLYDFEWESEKRVLRSLSEKLISSEQILVGCNEIYEDLLYTSMRYVEQASERKAAAG